MSNPENKPRRAKKCSPSYMTPWRFSSESDKIMTTNSIAEKMDETHQSNNLSWFSTLPDEIQLQIWREMFPCQENLTLDVSQNSRAISGAGELAEKGNRFPVALWINTQSRRETLTHYRFFHSTGNTRSPRDLRPHQRSRPLYLFTRPHTLHLNVPSVFDHIHDDLQVAFNELFTSFPEFHHSIHIMIVSPCHFTELDHWLDGGTWDGSTQSDSGFFATLGLRLPNLTKLICEEGIDIFEGVDPIQGTQTVWKTRIQNRLRKTEGSFKFGLPEVILQRSPVEWAWGTLDRETAFTYLQSSREKQYWEIWHAFWTNDDERCRECISSRHAIQHATNIYISTSDRII